MNKLNGEYPIILFESIENQIKHLVVKYNNRYYKICDLKFPTHKIEDFRRCEICFDDEIRNIYSFNTTTLYWQKTPRRKYRNNLRKVQIGNIFRDSNYIDYIYLGVYSSYDVRKNKELKNFYLIKRDTKEEYKLTKNLEIDKIKNTQKTIFNLKELKKSIIKQCKTFDDYIQYSNILNLTKGEKYKLFKIFE